MGEKNFKGTLKVMALASSALICLCASVVTAIYVNTSPVRIFDSVWNAVDRKYYDRTFNGYDWRRVRKTFRAKVPIWDDGGAKTDEVISSMLGLLESSHLEYVSSSQAKALPEGPGMSLLTPDSMSLVGLSVVGFGHPKSPIILHVEPKSALYAKGVRAGDHILIGVDHRRGDSRTIICMITSRDGKESEVNIVLDGHHTDVIAPVEVNRVIVFDKFVPEAFSYLSTLRKDSKNSDMTVNYPSLGLITTLGQSADQLSVIDVDKGSTADLEGIEIGSALKEMVSKSSSGGNIVMSLTIELPNGIEKKFESEIRPEITRQWNPYRRSATLVGSTMVIRFDKFSEEDIVWLEAQLKQHGDGPVVLDLRNNSGGLVSSLQRFMGSFLPSGTAIVETRDAAGATILRVPRGAVPTRARLAVLVGPVSASAAEVAAATLQAYNRATIVGRRTSGEVLVAVSYTLPNGAVLQIPWANLRDAKGRDLEGYGVEPDVSVWKTLTTIREGRDLPLEAALEAVSSGMSKTEGAAYPEQNDEIAPR